jgi:glucosyl-3-phosphoglycerate phosphatase
MSPGPATLLLLLRHAESTWNARGLWQGQADPPLSDAGRKQAADCAARVRQLAPAIAVASDLRRAQETARLVCGELALRIDARWREWDVGAWSGRPRAEIRERWPELYRAVRAGEPDVTPPGGESRATFSARVSAAAAELVASHPGERVLVVTHRGVILSLLPGSEPRHLEVHPLQWVDGSGVERKERPEAPADQE